MSLITFSFSLYLSLSPWKGLFDYAICSSRDGRGCYVFLLNKSNLYNPFDLEEAAEPPDLEDRLPDDNAEDEDVPPFDSGVCAFGRVAVGSLTHDNVGLFIFDLSEELLKLLDYLGSLLVSSKCRCNTRDKGG